MIFGNDRYIYQYISEMYPEPEVKFDISKIKLTTLDIEVKSENGFPDVESAAEEILLISIQDYTIQNRFAHGVKAHSITNKIMSFTSHSIQSMNF